MDPHTRDPDPTDKMWRILIPAKFPHKGQAIKGETQIAKFLVFLYIQIWNALKVVDKHKINIFLTFAFFLGCSNKLLHTLLSKESTQNQNKFVKYLLSIYIIIQCIISILKGHSIYLFDQIKSSQIFNKCFIKDFEIYLKNLIRFLLVKLINTFPLYNNLLWLLNIIYLLNDTCFFIVYQS